MPPGYHCSDELLLEVRASITQAAIPDCEWTSEAAVYLASRDLIAYATIPRGPDMLPYLHGAALAAGTVFTAAVYAWIALSGR